MGGSAEVLQNQHDNHKRRRQKYKKTGEVKDNPPRRKTFKKLDLEKLKTYVKEHPDAYLKEIGEAFGCSYTVLRRECTLCIRRFSSLLII